MKKIFTLFALCSLMFAACENGTDGSSNVDEPKETTLTILSEQTVNIGSSSTMGIVMFKIENPSPEYTLAVDADVDWIGSFDLGSQDRITYSVEQNNTYDARTGVITISYGELSADITIVQAGLTAPEEITVEADMVVGIYYGVQSGYYNYYVVFSDKGMSSYESGGNNYFNVPNAYYYILDIYSFTAPEDESHKLHDGTYHLGNQGDDEFIGKTYSWLQLNDEQGSGLEQYEYLSATLTVEGDKLTLKAVLFKDDVEQLHIVTYEGDYSLINM